MLRTIPIFVCVILISVKSISGEENVCPICPYDFYRIKGVPGRCFHPGRDGSKRYGGPGGAISYCENR